MYLKEYLQKTHQTVGEFSETIGYTKQHLYAIMAGRSKPNKRILKIITIATGGLVTAGEVATPTIIYQEPPENPFKELEKKNGN